MMFVGCGWSEPSAFCAWIESVIDAAGAAATEAERLAAAGAGAAAGENGALRSVLMAFMEVPFNSIQEITMQKSKASVCGDKPIIGKWAWQG